MAEESPSVLQAAGRERRTEALECVKGFVDLLRRRELDRVGFKVSRAEDERGRRPSESRRRAGDRMEERERDLCTLQHDGACQYRARGVRAVIRGSALTQTSSSFSSLAPTLLRGVAQASARPPIDDPVPLESRSKIMWCVERWREPEMGSASDCSSLGPAAAWLCR